MSVKVNQAKIHAGFFRENSQDALKSASSIMTNAIRLAHQETLAEAREAVRLIFAEEYSPIMENPNNTSLTLLNDILGNEYTSLVLRDGKIVLTVDASSEFRDDPEDFKLREFMYSTSKIIFRLGRYIDSIENYTGGLNGATVHRFVKSTKVDFLNVCWTLESEDRILPTIPMLEQLRELSRASEKFIRFR